MIKFTLVCEKEHAFEGWFRSGDDFETQAKRGIVTCPQCGSTSVSKGLMAPNIGTKSNRRNTASPSTQGDVEPSTEPVVSSEDAAAALPEEVRQHVVKLARELRDHVTKNADNVGDKFAEEARKIHYEETEPRGIYGKATAEEAQDLADEGVDIHALPVLPEDRN